MAVFQDSRRLSAFHQRQSIENQIERLIAVLDDLDGDAEAEPWLGAPECHPRLYGHGSDASGDQTWWGHRSNDEEAQDDDDGVTEEHMPSIYSGPCSPAIGRRA